MLAVSTDRLNKTTQAYGIAQEIWFDTIRMILPTLLQLVR